MALPVAPMTVWYLESEDLIGILSAEDDWDYLLLSFAIVGPFVFDPDIHGWTEIGEL